MDQSALGLSREYLIKGLDDKIVRAYYNYMVDIAVIYGAERERAETELMESLEFEIALANVRNNKLSISLYQQIDMPSIHNSFDFISFYLILF